MSRKTMPCRHCGEPIIFVTSKKGKRIPCDPEEAVVHLYLRPPRTPKEESLCVVTEEGTTIAGVKAMATEVGTTRVEGYLAHRSNCMGEGK
jgi:hypothetical protein